MIQYINGEDMTNKQLIIDFIDNLWDKKRLPCADVRDYLDIGEKSWSKIWNDRDFIELMKKRRVKIGYTKYSNKSKYLIKY